MDKIILLPNKDKDPSFSLSLKVLDVLKTFCSKIYTEKSNAVLLNAGALGYDENTYPADAQLLLVLGGDGTMLHAAAEASAHNIPLLGVNIGRLGYLASLEPEEIEDLKLLKDDCYLEQQRMMLDVTVRHASGETEALGTALNDMVIDGCGHLADLRLYEREGYLDYRADGLIVATPTGSTAYSLSAGGPVVDENMNAICVTPICPRSFFSRSLLFPENASLRIAVKDARVGAHICIDGCNDFPLLCGDEVTVRCAEKRVHILLLKPRNLLEVLSTKMNTRHF